MRAHSILVGLMLWSVAVTATADNVDVTVDISEQKMTVYVEGRQKYVWKISSAREGYSTPRGDYRPLWITTMHRSKKYDNAPMPYSVFFNGGYAIHGTNQIRQLGKPASHGCVRLHPSNARKLYQLVKKYGKENTRIMLRDQVDPAVLAGHFKGPLAVAERLFN